MYHVLLNHGSGAITPLVAEYDSDIQRLKSQIASFHVSHLYLGLLSY